MTPCNKTKIYQQLGKCLASIFNPDASIDIFFRNVREFLPGYKTVHLLEGGVS